MLWWSPTHPDRAHVGGGYKFPTDEARSSSCVARFGEEGMFREVVFSFLLATTLVGKCLCIAARTISVHARS